MLNRTASENQSQRENFSLANKVAFACSILVAVVFVYSSIQHFRSPYRFLVATTRYSIVDGWVAVLASAALPPVQSVVGVTLLTFTYPRSASLIAVLLMLLFTGLHVFAIISGLQISCGCFGSSDEVISWSSVARNAVLLFSACYAFCFFQFYRAP
jgi:hypothetical protein